MYVINIFYFSHRMKKIKVKKIQCVKNNRVKSKIVGIAGRFLSFTASIVTVASTTKPRNTGAFCRKCRRGNASFHSVSFGRNIISRR